MSQPSDLPGNRAFTIGLIQDHASGDAHDNLVRSERLVREVRQAVPAERVGEHQHDPLVRRLQAGQ